MLSTHNLAGHAHNGCLLEIAHRRVYPALILTKQAVVSYTTISPLPVLSKRRYFFCCTFRKKEVSLFFPKSYLVRLSPSVRTFLSLHLPRKANAKSDRSARAVIYKKKDSKRVERIYIERFGMKSASSN